MREGQPDIVKALGDRRVTCLKRVEQFDCVQPDSALFKKEKPPADDKPRTNASEAKGAAWAASDAQKGECTRPSVKAECEAFAEATKTVQ